MIATGERKQVLHQLDSAGLHEVRDPGAVALTDPDQPEVLELLERFS